MSPGNMDLYSGWHLQSTQCGTNHLAGGQRVTRQILQDWLQAAARAEGIPQGRIGTHSLRIGGASALFNAGWDMTAIQRFGRWTGGLAFQGYLWETQDLTKGAARAMVGERGRLHAGIFMGQSREAQVRSDPARWSDAWAREAQRWV